MKILFVQKVKAVAGSEKYFLELIPELEKRGIETEFVCVCLKHDRTKTQIFIDAYRKRGLKIHVLEVKSDGSLLKICRFINKIYQQSSFDLVHSHLIHADFWCALLKSAGKIKVPLVSTKHGYDETYISIYGFSAEHVKPNLYYLLCKYAERHIDSSFAVSEGLKKFFVESGISKEGRIQTIHHGFNLPRIEKIKDPAFQFAKCQLIILGRVIPFKGHHLLIEALKVVKEKFSGFKLLIVGQGNEKYISELKTKISDYKLDDNVEFLGFQSNIYDYLVNSDLMVVPSISEGFGLVFLEALNSQIPIIGFDVPATNEIIKHEETGILINPYDAEAFGMAILTILNDKEKSKKLTAAGYKRLRGYFSLKRMVDETIAFYEDTLQNNKPK